MASLIKRNFNSLWHWYISSYLPDYIMNHTGSSFHFLNKTWVPAITTPWFFLWWCHSDANQSAPQMMHPFTMHTNLNIKLLHVPSNNKSSIPVYIYSFCSHTPIFCFLHWHKLFHLPGAITNCFPANYSRLRITDRPNMAPD